MSSLTSNSKKRINSESESRIFNRSTVRGINQNEHILEKDFVKPESIISSMISGYKTRTSSACKAIDSFLAFTMLTGICQAIYCALTKAFPYNVFIGVFSGSVGSFVFAANARLQLTRKSEPSKIENIHIIIEFIVCSIILNIFVANFIG